MRSPDTSAEAQAVQLEAYRALSPVARLGLALTMSDELMAVTAAGIRARNPEIDTDAVIAELHRILGHPEPVR
jgi:hypothetical protein